jgi:hypothetical protein
MRIGIILTSILLVGMITFVGVLFVGVLLLSIQPSYSTHTIIIHNASGWATTEYQFFVNNESKGQGVIAPGADVHEILKIRGNPDIVLTVIANGQNYERVFGGGGFGGPPAMPDTVYFVVNGVEPP